MSANANVANRREPSCVQPRRWATRDEAPPDERDAAADRDSDRQLPKAPNPSS